MGIKDKITEGVQNILKGIKSSKQPQEVTPSQEPEAVKTGREYSLSDSVLSEVLGIPTGLIANWRSVRTDRYLSDEYDNDIMETLRHFYVLPTTPVEEALQRAQEFVGKHLIVEQGGFGRVSISLTSIKNQDLSHRETRCSKIYVKPESRVNVPNGTQYDSYSVHYADYTESLTRENSGAYTVKSGVENIGRQIFKPTREGDYYCTEIRNYVPHNPQSYLLSTDADLERSYDVVAASHDPKKEFVRATIEGLDILPGMEDSFPLTCSHKETQSSTTTIHPKVQPDNFNLEENCGLSMGDLPKIQTVIFTQDTAQ